MTLPPKRHADVLGLRLGAVGHRVHDHRGRGRRQPPGATLGELRLRDEGVVVLGATLADGAWLGAPTFETRLHPGERLVVYGPAARVAEVSRRKTGGEGDRAHAEAVAEHRRGVAAAEREHTP